MAISVDRLISGGRRPHPRRGPSSPRRVSNELPISPDLPDCVQLALSHEAAKVQAMNPSKPHDLHVVAGGREGLERLLLRSVMFDLPDADSLSKRLTPAANGSPSLAPPSLAETAAPAPTDESHGA